MNERLKELWWKARIGYNNQNCDPEVLAKFAELIVRECASVIEKNHPEFTCKEDADNLYRKAGRMDAIDEILQHFGVEE